MHILEPYALLVGMENGTDAVENGTAIPQNMKLSYGPASPLLGIYPREVKAMTCTDTCPPMFTAALFRVARGGNNPRVLSIHR